MLGQLVCIDRRYQRMNCFNIREAQSLLRKRFFTDLINTHEQKLFLDKTMLGLKFRLNDENAVLPHMHSFFKYGMLSNAASPLKTYVTATDTSKMTQIFVKNQLSLIGRELNHAQNFLSSIYVFILTYVNQNFFLLSHRDATTFFKRSSDTQTDVVTRAKLTVTSNCEYQALVNM